MFDILKFGFIGGGNMVVVFIGGLIVKGVYGVNIVVVDLIELVCSCVE